jgi:hypothetical protein
MQTNTRYDRAERKKARRSGREKGAHVFIAGEVLGELAKCENLWYRLDGGARGRVVVTFYKEP